MSASTSSGFAPLFQNGSADGTIDFVEETEATLMFGMKATQYRLPVPAEPARWSAARSWTRRDDLQEYDCQISGERLVGDPAGLAPTSPCSTHRPRTRGATSRCTARWATTWRSPRCPRRVMVSVERIVEPAELLEAPEQARIPGHLVDAVVELPYGAYPSSCLPDYDADYG